MVDSSWVVSTSSIEAARAGSSAALDRVARAGSGFLHRQASRWWRRLRLPAWVGSATECVDDVWVKLFRQARARITDRAHFRCIALRLLRRALLDRQRRVRAARRAGVVDPRADVERLAAPEPSRLEVADWWAGVIELDREAARIAELHFIEGRTIREIALLLLRTPRQVEHRLVKLVERLRRRAGAAA